MNNLKLAHDMPIKKVLEVLIKTNNDKAILALVENDLDPFHEDGCLYCMLADGSGFCGDLDSIDKNGPIKAYSLPIEFFRTGEGE